MATTADRESVAPARRAWLPAEELAGYLFVAPALLLAIIFVVWPILQSFGLSFFEWNGDGPRTFVGLDNYAALAQDSAAIDAFGHNFIFVVGYTFFEVFFGFLLAALLNTRVRGVVFFRTIYFLPVVAPTAISALLWSLVLAPTVDPFGAFFRAVGLPFLARSWLGDSDIALYTVTAIAVWKNVGIAMIVYLAAMQSIPGELLEAAAIDGAGPLRRLFAVVLPLLRPITAVLVALSVIYSMRTFDIVWALTGSSPRPALEMVSTLIVRTAFSFHEFGMASALAVVLFLVIFALAAVQIVTMERE